VNAVRVARLLGLLARFPDDEIHDGLYAVARFSDGVKARARAAAAVADGDRDGTFGAHVQTRRRDQARALREAPVFEGALERTPQRLSVTLALRANGHDHVACNDVGRYYGFRHDRPCVPKKTGSALRWAAFLLAWVTAAMLPAGAQQIWPAPLDGTYTVPQFRFGDGETLRDLRLHYVTLGKPHRSAAGHVDNAVLVLHGTGGDTNQFLREIYAGVLFVPGGALDATKYFIIITDGIGHGKSAKPSDGMRAQFPRYGYRDMVAAQHSVVADALHVDHLRLVTGTSMGGMHTWLWGEMYPAMMDALMPLASLPVQISGRNRIWRDMIVDALRSDPAYAKGDYQTEPAEGLRAAGDLLWIFGSAPLYNQSQLPTQDAADAYYRDHVRTLASHYDANDLIYQLEASRDYNPQPALGTIVAPLVAINSADDQINPPELGIVDREIGKVKHGRFVLLPITERTRGHGTHTHAEIWQSYLRELLTTTGAR